MKQTIDYTFSSALAPAIEGLIAEKRASGYIYNSNAVVLKELDTFCIEHGFHCETVTKELADAWSVQRKTEGISSRNIRVSKLRQVSLHLCSLGIECYIPKMNQSTETKEAHVFSAKERVEFFECLNSIDMGHYGMGGLLLEECRVLFRLYYCCGMRLSEPLHLTWGNIDFDSGKFTILQSKGYKDRAVFFGDDIKAMLLRHREYIMKKRPGEPLVFPGTKPGKSINKISVRAYFRKVLLMTSYADIGNPPTIKSFRHSFVVDRLNEWMATGEDIQTKLPYLSKYLGHSSIRESLYYYHQVAEGFRIIREKDKTSDNVIPEVTDYEKENY